jgi:hypothetical protein
MEKRIVIIYAPEINRNKRGHPSVAMDNIWSPAELFNSLDNTACKEEGTFIIVLKLLPDVSLTIFFL